MKKILSVIALFSIAFTACRKDPINNTAPFDIDTTPKKTTIDSSFQPATKGSYWIYKDSISSKVDTLKSTSAGYDTTVNSLGETFQTFIDSTYSTKKQQFHLYNINNHVYKTRLQYPLLGTNYTLNLNYLNDTASVGYTWKDTKLTDNGTITFSGITVPVQLLGKIAEKGIFKIVNGVTYYNVYHSTLKIQYSFLPPNYTDALTIEYYVAKGVGLIHFDTKSSAAASGYVDLVQYKIK